MSHTKDVMPIVIMLRKVQDHRSTIKVRSLAKK
jgi:hypothetical protein